jgi:diguanylate cyclase (GGDEF)-like protein
MGITANSLPEYSRISHVNNTLKDTLYFTEKLTNANNHAARRIAFDSLNKLEDKLTDLTGDFGDSLHLSNQIKTAKKEIDDLNILVSKRINNESLVQIKIDEAYSLQDKIISGLTKQGLGGSVFEKFTMPIIQSVMLSQKTLSLSRLQPVRQLAREVSQNIKHVLIIESQHSVLLASDIKNDITLLSNLLLSDAGLFNLKIEQLQVVGRSRGRGNFLYNLIADISILSEARFYEINESIVNEAQKTTKQIAEQVRWSISLAIFIIFLLFTIIYFINHKIVARLLALNESVIKRIQSQSSSINTNGQDEISYLARSFVYFSEKVEKQKKQLKEQSLTDGLTNLANRRALDERLVYEISMAQRGNLPLSIILLDIDYFKRYNDYYGHVSGDECLQRFALGLKSIRQRDCDFIARYGGEEFVMLLPATDKEGAIKVAKHIKVVVEQLQLTHEKSTVSKYLTVSTGVATFTDNDLLSVDEILTITDKALYHSKYQGRNTYTHADDMN